MKKHANAGAPRPASLFIAMAMVVCALPAVAQAKPEQACTDAQKADPKTSAACAAATPKATAGSPFPGDDADISAGPGAKPDAPAAPLPQTPSATKAADPHPFPGDTDPPTQQPVKPGADTHPYPGDPDAPKQGTDDGFSSSSSGSSSSGSSSDAAADPLKDAGSSGEDTKSPKGKRRKLPKIDAQTPEARESEDLDVAQFYMQTGNTVGAYARAQDAVSIMPDDPFAQFALAEAARKSGKLDEAREHYAKVLTLDPNDKQIRASKLALEQLKSAAK